MDVHPPHAPLHSWKDFWIHLGTITIGLLIAISLEQTVEFVHRMHERHILQGDLRAEAERNREVVATDFKFYELELRWLDDMSQDIAKVRASHGMLKLPPRESYVLQGSAYRYQYLNPSDAVWTTAKDGNALALLPRGDAQVYARLYRLAGFVIEQWWRADQTLEAFNANKRNFRVGTGAVDLSVMSDAQLEHFNDLIQERYAAEARLTSLLHYFNGTNEAILSGARTEAEVQQAMYTEAARAHRLH